MPFYLGIDIGGTVTKCGLYDGDGLEMAVASRTDPLIVPRVGWSERDMNALWRTVCATVREVLASGKVKARDVVGVSFSAHGKGLYAVDATGKPVPTASSLRIIAHCRSFAGGRTRGSTPKPIPTAISRCGRDIRCRCWLGSRRTNLTTTGGPGMC